MLNAADRAQKRIRGNEIKQIYYKLGLFVQGLEQNRFKRVIHSQMGHRSCPR